MTAGTSTVRKYRVGEKVTPDPDGIGIPEQTLGRVFTVAKVNPRNLRCSADDGGRGINFPPHLLLPATDENVAKSTTPRPFQEIEFFTLGEIVTMKRGFPAQGITPNTPMVVFKDNGDKVNLTKLGGAGDRYVRVPHAAVVRRDMQWLAEALLEEATAA